MKLGHPGLPFNVFKTTEECNNPFSTGGMSTVSLTRHPRLRMIILDTRPIGQGSSMVIINQGWRVRITIHPNCGGRIDILFHYFIHFIGWSRIGYSYPHS